MADVSFGEWLKRRRKAAGWTQEQLAQQISCSTSALKKIEAEERRPSEQIVERLAEIFNIPSHEQSVFLRFARGDWKSAPMQSLEDAPWRASTKSPPSNIPATTTSFIGRESEIADIRAYLLSPEIRLVTLIGPPGIGKTRLSLEVAKESIRDFADEVFFILLAPLDDPDLVAPTIAQALGFVETKNQSPFERLKDGIGEKQVLLVLDNFEHLTDGAAPLVSDLLVACPRLKSLITSREALRVPGEWLYSVPALNIPTSNRLETIKKEDASEFTALTLFAERARAVRSDFALHADNIQTVATICAQLDGLPLAIELIAARIRLMSPQSLLDHLNDQLTLYADGMRAVSTRQKTLHNAIAWSFNLLTPEEQKLFAYLSVFSGGFTLEAAESIFARTVTDKSVPDLIASLLDKSLLQRTLDRDAHDEPRFHMLVTIQQFALNYLRQKKEETEVRNWHLAYFLELAEKADQEIHGPDQITWMDRLEIDHDNLRAALDWSFVSEQIESHLRLFGALVWFRRLRSFVDEARAGFEKIRRQPSIVNYPAAYAKVLNEMGRMIWRQGDSHDAQMLLEESQEIWQKLGADGKRGLAGALDFLGMVQWVSGYNKQAQSFFEQGVELYRRCGDQWGLAEGLFHLGIVAAERNEKTLAFSWFEQSLALFKQLGDLWGIGRVSTNLGELFMRQGDFEQAHSIFEQALHNDRRLKFIQGIVDHLLSLALLNCYRGDYDQSMRLSEEHLVLSQKYGLKSDMAGAFYSLGSVALHRDDYSVAKQYFTDSLDIVRALHATPSVCELLTGFAAIAAGTKQPERAAKLSGAAQAILVTIDYQISVFDQAEFDRHIQIARKELGDTRFEALAAEGHTMTMEQAISYALEERD